MRGRLTRYFSWEGERGRWERGERSVTGAGEWRGTRVWSHCRFRQNGGTESVRASGIGADERQRSATQCGTVSKRHCVRVAQRHTA